MLIRRLLIDITTTLDLPPPDRKMGFLDPWQACESAQRRTPNSFNVAKVSYPARDVPCIGPTGRECEAAHSIVAHPLPALSWVRPLLPCLLPRQVVAWKAWLGDSGCTTWWCPSCIAKAALTAAALRRVRANLGEACPRRAEGPPTR